MKWEGMPFYKRGEFTGRHRVCCDHPARRFRDAFRSGNGSLVMLDYGHPVKNRWTLTQEELYTPQWEEPPKAPLLREVLPEIQELLLEGHYEEADRLANETAEKNGTPPYYRPNYSHDGIWVEAEQKAENITDYLHIQNMRTGELSTVWATEYGSYRMDAFCSRADGTAVIRFLAREGTLNFHIRALIPQMPKEDEEKNVAGESWLGKIIPPQMTLACQDTDVVLQGTYAYHHGGFGAVLHGNSGDCCFEEEENGFHVFGGTECWFLLSVVRGGEGETEQLIRELKERLLKLTDSYEVLLERHKKIHTKLFDRVSLELGGEEGDYTLTLKEMLEKECLSKAILPAFLEAMFDMGRYFLLCECGKFPPIYGHVNINVNHQISCGNIDSLPELMESFFGWIERQLPDARENAERTFGTRGFVIACHPDMESGRQYHFNTEYPHEFWISSSGWCLEPFLEHYYCTGDETFRRERMIPLYRELAQLYVDFLTRKDENGKWIFVPSYSPENFPLNHPIMTSVNAAMDVEVCREVMETLLNYGADMLSEEEKEACHIVLNGLPDYLYGERGEIKEWLREDLEERHDHRHISQLYGAFPGDEFQPERNMELYGHARITNRIRGMENESCHGIMHRAQIAARLKDSALVEEFLRFTLESGYVNDNFTTAHNPYRDHVFPDGQGAIPTVLTESIVYARPGFIELLPAAESKSLQKGCLKGVSLRTAAKLEEIRWDEKQVSAELCFLKEQEVIFCCRRARKMTVTDKQGNVVLSSETPEVYTRAYCAAPGECIHIHAELGKE